MLAFTSVMSFCTISFQLGTDTWFYAKRCFLSLLENMVRKEVVSFVLEVEVSKHTFVSVLNGIVSRFGACASCNVFNPFPLFINQSDARR